MFSFKLFVENYSNKKNPATNKVWTLAEIAADTGAGGQLIEEWFGIVKTKNVEMLESEGRAATDAELIQSYEEKHPNQDAVQTPFGVSYIERGSSKIEGMLVSELTVVEFRSLMQDILASKL